MTDPRGASAGNAETRPTRLRHVWLIVAVYSVTHALSLLNRGLFWDDWVFWQQDKLVVAQVFKDLGSTWPPHYFYAIFYSQPGITLGRALTFGALLVSAVCIYHVVAALPRTSSRTALWVALVFSVFPVFQARIALVIVTYSLSLMFFFVATLALVRSIERRKVWMRAVALVLYLASFRTASLLVIFVVTVPFLIIALETRAGARLKDTWRALLRHADVVAAPFVFWAVSSIWFKPGGSSYSGYNEMIEAPASEIARMVRDSAWDSLANSLLHAATTTPASFLVGGVAVMAGLVLLASRKERSTEAGGGLWIAVWGVMLLLAGVFPYVMVGKLPSGLEWETRHQLLIPLAAALVIGGLLDALADESRWRGALATTVLIGTLGISLGADWYSYIGYQRDWLKQEALLEHFSASQELRSGTTFLVRDEARRFDYDPRTRHRFYEYTGMMRQLFGDERRLVISASDYGRIDPGRLRKLFTDYYNVADYVEGPPEYTIVITEGDVDLRSTGEVLKLTALDWSDRGALADRVKDAVRVEFEPVE